MIISNLQMINDKTVKNRIWKDRGVEYLHSVYAIFSFIVQYLVYLHQYFNEWRKNPQWSFSCCLALLLPLNDMQGDVQGVVGTNILDTQLETGMMDKPSIADCVQDSGALSFALAPAEGEGDDVAHLESQEQICIGASKRTLVKSNRGTQTDLFMPSAYVVAAQQSFEDTYMW